MGKSEILDELPKLPPEERQEIRVRFAELDSDDWLDAGAPTAAERALIEQRFWDLEADPQTSTPCKEAKNRLMAPFKR